MYIPKDIWLVKHNSRDIAFFVPKPEEEVNTTQETFEKRQKTALTWARDGNYGKSVPVESLTQHEFSNDFQHGFKFITTSGRWQTEAEYIVIKHPNGFSFEIYTSNLLEVLRADGCAKGGVLNGEYRMFYNMNGKWSIYSKGSSLEPEMDKLDAATRENNAKKKKAKSIKLVEGMVVKIGNDNHEWVYVGKQELAIEGSMGEVHYRQFHKLKEGVLFATKNWEFTGSECTVITNSRNIESNWRDDAYTIGSTVHTGEDKYTLDIPKLITFVTKGGKICQFKSKSVYIIPVDDGNKFNQEVVEQFKSGKKYDFAIPVYSSGYDYEELLIQIGWNKSRNAYSWGGPYGREAYSGKVASLDKAPKIGDTWQLFQSKEPFETIGYGNWGGFTAIPHVKFKCKESK